MSDSNPLLYYDKENHIWEFYLTDNGELAYNIMYEENKWTKGSRIDSEIINFAVNIDNEEKLYIVYNTKDGLVKYCVWKDNQWFGKTLYSFENKSYQIGELETNATGEDINIFFISRNRRDKRFGTLMHFCWSGISNINNTVYDIELVQGAQFHYQVEKLEDGRQFLVLITNEDEQVSVKFTEYKNNKWSIPKRLYGVNGSDISFSTLRYRNRIGIINLSREDLIYSLEHVVIEPNGNMSSYKVCESLMKPMNYSFFEKNGTLCIMWVEGEAILFSTYKDGWKGSLVIDKETSEDVISYQFISLNSKYKNINAKAVLGKKTPDLKLLLFNEVIGDYDDNQSSEESITNLAQNNTDSENGLVSLRKYSKSVDKKLVGLEMQLLRKQKVIEDMEENLLKQRNERRKLEKKLSIITDMQKSYMKELEEIKGQKIEIEKVLNDFKKENQSLALDNDMLKIKLDESQAQKTELRKTLSDLRNEIQGTTLDNDKLKVRLEENRSQSIEMDRLLAELRNEIETISLDSNKLKNERDKLQIELEHEKSKGFVDKILKRK